MDIDFKSLICTENRNLTKTKKPSHRTAQQGDIVHLSRFVLKLCNGLKY